MEDCILFIRRGGSASLTRFGCVYFIAISFVFSLFLLPAAAMLACLTLFSLEIAHIFGYFWLPFLIPAPGNYFLDAEIPV